MNNTKFTGGQCAVSVTGKHRIEHPYCKDCGLVIDARELTDAISIIQQWRDEKDRPTDQLVAADLIIDRLQKGYIKA